MLAEIKQTYKEMINMKFNGKHIIDERAPKIVEMGQYLKRENAIDMSSAKKTREIKKELNYKYADYVVSKSEKIGMTKHHWDPSRGFFVHPPTGEVLMGKKRVDFFRAFEKKAHKAMTEDNELWKLLRRLLGLKNKENILDFLSDIDTYNAIIEEINNIRKKIGNYSEIEWRNMNAEHWLDSEKILSELEQACMQEKSKKGKSSNAGREEKSGGKAEAAA